MNFLAVFTYLWISWLFRPFHTWVGGAGSPTLLMKVFKRKLRGHLLEMFEREFNHQMLGWVMLPSRPLPTWSPRRGMANKFQTSAHLIDCVFIMSLVEKNSEAMPKLFRRNVCDQLVNVHLSIYSMSMFDCVCHSCPRKFNKLILTCIFMWNCFHSFLFVFTDYTLNSSSYCVWQAVSRKKERIRQPGSA